MPTPFAKSVAVFLLVMQVLIALTPGRVLCIPIAHCDDHAQGSGRGHHHAEHGDCSSHPTDHTHRHSHGPLDLAWHFTDQHGCHLHLPVPTDDQPPAKPRGETPEVRACLGPPAVAILVAWTSDSAPSIATIQRPPDPGASGQWRALKVTRLLI